MTVNYRKTSVANGETRYAHPADVTHTVKVSVSTTPKKAGPVALTNNKLEYIENFNANVTNGTDNAKEVVSIRILVSGSTQSEAAITTAVSRAFINFQAIIADKGLVGFMPEVALIAE